MKTTIIAMFAVVAMTALSACDSGEKKTDSKEVASEQNETKFEDTKLEDDMEFAVAAAEGGMMEVRLGQLAATNATSPKVKELGRMMVADHTRANDELKSLAAKKNITLPADLSNDKQKAYEELAAKKGKDFDEAYAEFMVADHKEDIELFQHQADDGKDADLKAWAAGKVSVLKHHLQMAQTTKDAVD